MPDATARPFVWLDVFTDTRLSGNGLAVVHDADGLDDATMLAFARETKLSETTFVQSPGADGADYRNRIWMTTRELPFAGHPSLGTAVAVAVHRGEREARYVQQTVAGLQPIDVELRDGGRAHASMLQEPTRLLTELDPAEVMAAAGLRASAAHQSLPPYVVTTGVPQLIVPVSGSLDAVRPVADRLRALLHEHGAVTLYLAAGELAAGRAHARSFFYEEGAAAEDPATGSACGPLMGYLHERLGLTRLEVRQGLEMGRPSRLECSVEDGRVRVGGDAVVVAEGTVTL